MVRSLTQKQKLVLVAVQDLKKKHNKSPTMEEIRQALGYASVSSVQRHLDALKQKGYIKNEKFQNRTLDIVGNTINIPLVGNVSCGTPLYAEENVEAYIPYSAEKVRNNPSNLFFLRAVGDSMNKSNIQGKTIDDGDLVLVKQTNSAEYGEKVVALIGEEATIKKLKKGDGFIVLEPESTNDKNKPIILVEDPIIQGRVIDVVKKGGNKNELRD